MGEPTRQSAGDVRAGAANPLPMSVVIPTYNRAHLISRSVNSVLPELLPGDEIIVVDDGSTDDTERVVAAMTGPIRYMRQQNAGAGPARNRGFEASRNPLVAMLDSDDEWIPGKSALQRGLMVARPDLVYTFSDFMVKKNETEVFRRYVSNWHHDPRPWSEILAPGVPFSSIAPLPAGWSDFPVHIGNLYDSLMATNYVATFALVMRREAIGAIRFSEDLFFCEDWELFAVAAKVGPVAYLDVETAIQWGHDGPRLTQTNEYKMASSRIKMMERVWGSDAAFMTRHGDEYKCVLAEQHATCARWLLRHGRTREARQALRNVPRGRFRDRALSRMPGTLVHAMFSVSDMLRYRAGEH